MDRLPRLPGVPHFHVNRHSPLSTTSNDPNDRVFHCFSDPYKESPQKGSLIPLSPPKFPPNPVIPMVIFGIPHPSPLVRESKKVLDSGFRISDTRFQSLSMELGSWIPILSEIPNSLSCILDSTSKISPDTGIPDLGYNSESRPRFALKSRIPAFK